MILKIALWEDIIRNGLYIIKKKDIVLEIIKLEGQEKLECVKMGAEKFR